MRFSATLFVAALSATATYAQLFPNAAPVNNDDDAAVLSKLAHLRLGLAAANVRPPMPVPMIEVVRPQHAPQRKHKCGKMLRLKANRIANAFRKYMGLPVIEATDRPHEHHHHPHPHHHAHVVGEKMTPVPAPEVHIMPVGKFAPRPVVSRPAIAPAPWFETTEAYPLRVTILRVQRLRTPEDPFLVRLNDALLRLGKWEGRIVSFVLGLGVGALIRMFVILAIITARSIKARRQRRIQLQAEEEEAQILFVAPEYPEEKRTPIIVVETVA